MSMKIVTNTAMQKKILFFLILSLFGWMKGFSQTPAPTMCSPGLESNPPVNMLVTTTASGIMTVCGPEITFTVRLDYQVTPAGTMLGAKDIDVKILLPKGIEFVNFSSTEAIGNAELTSQTGTVADGQLLDIALKTTGTYRTIASNGFDEFYFKAKARCGLISALSTNPGGAIVVRNITVACYQRINANSSLEQFGAQETEGSGSYNVQFPSLELGMAASQKEQPGTKGDVIQRDLIITNAGAGSLDMTQGFKVYVDHQFFLENSVFTATGFTVTPSAVGPFSYVLTITGSGSFDQNEMITLHETSRMNNCTNSVQTDYRVEWGCNTDVCNPNDANAVLAAYVNRPSTLNPNISTELINENDVHFSFCSGDLTTFAIRYTNLGETNTNATFPSGNKARLSRLDWQAATASGFGVSTGFQNFRIKKQDGSFFDITSMVSITNYTSNNFPNFPGSNGRYVNVFINDRAELATTNADPDGIGYGLEDLDNDGYYDDLGVNKTLDIYVDVVMNGCVYPSTLKKSFGHFFSYARMVYFNACDFSQIIGAPVHHELNYNSDGQQVEGDPDIVQGQTKTYSLEVKTVRGRQPTIDRLDCSVTDAIITTLTVPNGLVLSGSTATFTPQGGGAQTFPASQSGSIITITGGGFYGRYDLPLTVNCGASGISFENTMRWQSGYHCQGTFPGCADCVLPLADTTVSIFIHCPDCPGYHTTAFNVERSNYGYPVPSTSYTVGTLPAVMNKSTALAAGANPKIALEEDAMTAQINGYLDGPTSYTNAYIRMEYTVPGAAIGNRILDFNGGSAVIRRTGQPDQTVTLGTPSYSTGATNVFYIDFQVNLPGVYTQFEPGDQIDVSANLSFRSNAQTGLNVGRYNLQRFRAEHYFKNGTAIENNCENFGSNMSLMVKKLVPRISKAVEDGCTLYRYAWLEVQGGTDDDFPGEFRPLGHIATVQLTLPSWAASQSSVTSLELFNAENGGGASITPITPSATSGSTLTWNRGSGWPVSGHKAFYFTDIDYQQRSYEIIRIGYRATCQPDVNVYGPSVNQAVSFTYRPVDHLGTQVYSAPGTVASSTTHTEQDGRNVTYENGTGNSTISFSANSLQEGFSQNITWPVFLQNNNKTTPGTWLYIKPTAGTVGRITSLRAFDMTNPASPTALIIDSIPGGTNFLVHVGDVSGLSTKQVNLVATYKNCVDNLVEGFDVLGSWTCGTPPTLAELNNDTYNCIKATTTNRYYTFSGQLQIRYKLSRLSLPLITQSPEVAEVCDETEFTVHLLSDRYADVNTVDIEVQLPDGVEISGLLSDFGKFIYPGNNTIERTLLSPSQGTIGGSKPYSKYLYQLFPSLSSSYGPPPLPALPQYGDVPKELPGSRVLTDTDPLNQSDNEIILKFKVKTVCPEFDPGYPVRFKATYKTNCGEGPITVNAQRKIKLNNFAPDEMSVSVLASNYTACGSTAGITIHYNNLNTTPTAYTNVLTLSIPAGINYVPGSVSPSALSTTLSPDGRTLSIVLPIGITKNTQDYTITLQTQLVNAALTGADFTAMIQTLSTSGELPPFVCQATLEQCNLNITVAEPFPAHIDINVPIPTVVINASTELYCEGRPVTFTAAATSGSLTGYNYLEWFVNGSTTVAGTGTTFVYTPSSGSSTVSFSAYNLDQTSTSTKICEATATKTIATDPVITLEVESKQDVTCHQGSGSSDGQYVFSLSGGAGGPYQFFLSGTGQPSGGTDLNNIPSGSTLTFAAGSTYVIGGLSIGTYTIRAIDRNGLGCETTLAFDIGYGGPVVSLVCVSYVSCSDEEQTGNIVFQTTRTSPSASGSYEYRITNAATGYASAWINANFASLITVTGLDRTTGTGEYVIETRTFNSITSEFCFENLGGIFIRPPVLSIDLGDNLDDGIIYTCGDEQDQADVTITANLGLNACSAPVGQYMFLVEKSTDLGATYTTLSTQQQASGSYLLENLGIGYYRVTVTETAYGCSNQVSFRIEKSGVFSVSVLNTTDATCPGASDGTAQAHVDIGTGRPEFSYTWMFDNRNLVTTYSGATYTSFAAGNYIVQAMDANGCTAEASFAIDAPEPITAAVSVSSCDVSVTLSQNGNPLSAVTGVQYTYNFLHKPELSIQSQTTTIQPAITVNNIPNGDYTLQVLYGPSLTCATTADFTVNTNPPIDITLYFRWTRRPPEVIPPAIVVPKPPTEEIKAVINEIENNVEQCALQQTGNSTYIFDKFCLAPDLTDDTLKIHRSQRYYHYTLYYYDRAGNLTATVPPKGVQDLLSNAANVPASCNDHPDYTFKTTYEYNTFKQLQSQNTPDGGTTKFIYNDLQLRFSQNPDQAIASPQEYSYTKYDNISRINEVGNATFATSITNFSDLQAQANLGTSVATTFPVDNGSQVLSERTYTVYNTAQNGVDYFGKTQRYLRNRVSATWTENKNGQFSYSFYSYDPHGNVEWLVQEVPGLSRFTTAYEYDLYSNKVRLVKYNEKLADRFFHRYNYDEDNRITLVETSKDGVFWDKDANYQYFLHGPLKRAGIGEDKIQGCDYAYTIHGWLKAMNTPALNNGTTTEDPGQDGYGSSEYLKDAWGMSLGYFQGDFKNAGSVFETTNTFTAGTNYRDLFNGNISSRSHRVDVEYLSGIGTAELNALQYHGQSGNVYRYDRLNRLKQSILARHDGTNLSTNDYSARYSFDPNGNIMTAQVQTYQKAGFPDAKMDKLAYNYGQAGTNKLTHVDDDITLTSKFTEDIDDQNANNYQYDQRGNLIRDEQEKITVEWNVYGKVAKVQPIQPTCSPCTETDIQPGAIKPLLNFTYDATGNRVKKEVNRKPFKTDLSPELDPLFVTITYYVRDASGNVMAIYERSHDNTGLPVGEYKAIYTLKELPLYGSDRLGEAKPEQQIFEKKFTMSDWESLDQTGFSREDFYTRYSEYQSWLVPQESSEQLTVAGTDYKISTTSLASFDNTTAASATLLNFNGSSGPGVTVAEQVDPKTNTRTVAFYATTAEQYWGKADIGLVYDKNGLLMPGVSNAINTSGESKPVVLRKPGSETIWYMFTTAANGSLLRHTIDMGQTGNGTTGNPLGVLVQVNEAVSLPAGELTGARLMGLEDQANGRFVLLTTAYDAVNHKTKLYSILYSEEHPDGFLRTIADKTGYGAKSEELVLNKNGKELAWYHYKERQGWFDQHEAEIHTYKINGDLSVVSDEETIVVTDGTINGSGIDYSHNKGYIYYEQRSLTNLTAQTTSKGTWAYNLSSTATVSLLADKTGEIRRGLNDQEIFIADQCSATLTKLTEGANGTYTASESTMPAEGLLTGHLPSQVQKLYDPNAFDNLFERIVDIKVYELKDHLGNVMATVSDRRAASISGMTVSNTPELKFYGEYYPFGMLQPGRTYSINDGYRYGFNGQEKDDDINGSQNIYDYGARIYNPRIGRFLSVDPLMKSFPMLTPYQFASNTPIQAIDLDGLEAVKVVDHTTKTTTVIINVVYVPNKIDDPNYGSGFSKQQIAEIKEGINNEISSTQFYDDNNKDSEGNPYKVNFNVNFIEANNMKEADALVDKQSDRSTLLKSGGRKIVIVNNADGTTSVKITLASTSINELALSSSKDQHTNTHELFHAIVHFSGNTPASWDSDLDMEDQGPWHEKFGGIFSYKEKLPLSKKNVDQSLEVTPTILNIPVMGPYTPEQQSYLNGNNSVDKK